MNPSSFINAELLNISKQDIALLAPYIWIIGGILLSLVCAMFKSLSGKWSIFAVTMATLFGLMWSSCNLFGLNDSHAQSLFGNMLATDVFSYFLYVVFAVAGIVTLMISIRYLDRDEIQHPEYPVLVLFSVLGMMLLVSALDYIVLFIALEIMSLAVYVLVGFRRADRKSNEAALKYFILGGAASAIYLYGAALVFGATQSIELTDTLAVLKNNPAAMTPMFILGAWLVIIGFLFKVAVAPFHMWMPDVYEGAPTPITGFMTTGVKVASFGVFARVLIHLGYGAKVSEAFDSHLNQVFWVLAVLTMIAGNFTALTQTNLKRMLGYSSIAHTGYLLVGLLTASRGPDGYAPVFTYLVAYTIMNLGAFAILTLVSTRDDHGLNLADFCGLSKRHPWIAAALSLFLLSMAGIPPTVGFSAKYLMLYSAVQAGEVPLVIIAVLTSAVSVYYYLRVIVYMYMKDPVGSAPNSRLPLWTGVAIFVMAFFTLQLGIMPSYLMELATRAVGMF